MSLITGNKVKKHISQSIVKKKPKTTTGDNYPGVSKFFIIGGTKKIRLRAVRGPGGGSF
jgi:hypothetical protein